eukprot:1507312-Pyramimonas_sp.AAC.1
MRPYAGPNPASKGAATCATVADVVSSRKVWRGLAQRGPKRDFAALGAASCATVVAIFVGSWDVPTP